MTFHQVRAAARKVFSLKQNRSGGKIARLLRREVGETWVVGAPTRLASAIRSSPPSRSGGAAVAANKALKGTKTFLRWCVSRAVLDQSPAEGVPLPSKEVARDRVLNDNELAHVILAARKIGGPYGGIVELLALTGQRREEVARLQWPELDLAQRVWTLPKSRTKNAKAYVVRRRLLAKLTNRRLKRGVFRSVAELQVAIDRFIADRRRSQNPSCGSHVQAASSPLSNVGSKR